MLLEKNKTKILRSLYTKPKSSVYLLKLVSFPAPIILKQSNYVKKSGWEFEGVT